MVYTVDEVSVELGIPRPTVYRYLKEYSIPFTRRSGRIFVPQESVAKVRKVREMLEGGFGTEAVRSRLREGEDTELSRVTERLDKLVRVLEDSRTEAKVSVEPTRTSPDAHALRMVLARQSLLISAVSNLAEMVGDLMAANGLQRRAILDFPNTPGALERPARLHSRESRFVLPHSAVPPSGPPVRHQTALPSNIAHDKFGTLARRRRTALAAFLIAAVLVIFLTWQVL